VADDHDPNKPSNQPSNQRSNQGPPEPDDRDYRRLLELRTGLRQFLRWSEQQAEAVGIAPAQHQLLLAIRGHPRREPPTIGDVADSLMLRHHSAVGLVDRAVTAGLVHRRSDPVDRRVVRLQLTALGARRLRQLSGAHLEELRRLAPRMRSLWANLDSTS
jgi:DNA-binding MarR family transcriptional regulator